jgi:hypothetical protein
MTNNDEDRRLKQLERERKTARVVNAYHRVFSGNDGEIVLNDLSAVFGINLPAFLPLPNNSRDAYSPYYAAIRDGQRQVWLHIQARLEAPMQPDGNIEEPRNRILTGLSEDQS